MKQGSILCGLVIIVLLSLAGCSAEGELKISNKTRGSVFGKVNDQEFNLTAGENFEKSWDLSTSILGSETKNIEITYNGEYIWRETIETEVEAGNTKKIKLLPVAGSIKVINESFAINIVEVNIIPESEAFWGDNDLPENEILEPGNSLGWTVSEGNWDLRIIGDNGVVDEINNILIEVDSTQVFLYNGLD